MTIHHEVGYDHMGRPEFDITLDNGARFTVREDGDGLKIVERDGNQIAILADDAINSIRIESPR